jgi:isoleucyl-tRNA synthetase
VWFHADAAQFLGNAYDPAEWQRVTDIAEVWFDSGSTHAFVLEQRPELRWPASLYLEGSDQHRGWFQSSLVEACGTRGRAPYDAVLTHGFVLDEQGRKMSKSLGNVVAPQDVIKQSGADILRLWVVGSDYSDDLRIGPEILKHQSDVYRRLRNTLRYLLGALDGFEPTERVEIAAMPQLERWVLHRLAELDLVVRQSIAEFDFHAMFTALYNFCAADLSAFYFDIRKDRLYCDPPGDIGRRALRTVLDHTFDALVRWLAPIICFTAEEAWLARHGDAPGRSVHLEQLAVIPREWLDPALGEHWAQLRDLRRVVTGALEVERGAKRIGSSLQAAVAVYIPERLAGLVREVDLAELCITSAATVYLEPSPEEAFNLPDVPDIGVVVSPAEGERCERCWRVLPEVGDVPDHPDLCRRCAAVIDQRGVELA